MSFIESPSFPTALAYGAVGGPLYSTAVTATLAGKEQRNQAWAVPRGVWEVGMVNRSLTETQALLAFFRTIAQGRLNTFRFRDFGAGEDTGYAEPLGVGTGGSYTYQIIKRYTAGANTEDRTITKPMAGSVVVYINGTPTSSFSVDTTTGIITMTATLGAVLTVSFTFEVPVRFDQDSISITRVDPERYSIDSVKLVEVRL